MFGKRMLQSGLAGAILVSGSLFALSGPASATNPPTTSTPTSQKFLTAQKNLENQLAARVTQLGRLSSDVSASKTLSAKDETTLNLNISTAEANINALVVKVPTDTTMAQLRTDRASMLKQNRVYAVLTPQVFETIEADSVASQAAIFQGNEPSLQSSVNALVGQPGYKTAMSHYVAFVKAVNAANADSYNVDVAVLAQTPADYPGDTHVFVHANHELLSADISLAHAAYDETVIGLASGGYTGS